MISFSFKICLVFILFSSFKLFAQCDTSKAIYAIYPEDQTYLRYLYYQNNFDSAMTRYTFGEIRIIVIGNEQRVNLKKTLDIEEHYIQGDSIQGEDLILLNYGVSETFTYPEHSQLKFFRELAANAPCYQPFYDDTSKWSGGTGDWRDGYWAVGIDRIQDKTEFVLQLVRKSDNQVVAVLDSVGVAQNPNSILAQRYGTDPDLMDQTRNLTDNYADSIVYLRVSPRRTGLTPYGMHFKVINPNINLSIINEYTSDWHLSNCTSSKFDYLNNEFYIRTMNFCDSVKNATGWLPGNYASCTYFFTQEQDSIFLSTYFAPYILNNGDTVLAEIRNDSAQPALSVNDKILVNRAKEKLVRFVSLYPNPVTNGKLNITLDIKHEFFSSFNIFTTNGRNVGKYWSGKLVPGTSLYQINVSDITSGPFLLAVVNDNNEIIGLTKFIVSNSK